MAMSSLATASTGCVDGRLRANLSASAFAGPRGLQMIALNPEPISCKIFFKGAEKFSAPTCLEG